MTKAELLHRRKSLFSRMATMHPKSAREAYWDAVALAAEGEEVIEPAPTPARAAELEASQAARVRIETVAREARDDGMQDADCLLRGRVGRRISQEERARARDELVRIAREGGRRESISEIARRLGVAPTTLQSIACGVPLVRHGRPIGQCRAGGKVMELRRVAIFGKPGCGKCESAVEKFADGKVPGVMTWVKIERELPWQWGILPALEELKRGLGLTQQEAEAYARAAIAAWAFFDGDLPLIAIENPREREGVSAGTAPWAFSQLKAMAREIEAALAQGGEDGSPL